MSESQRHAIAVARQAYRRAAKHERSLYTESHQPRAKRQTIERASQRTRNAYSRLCALENTTANRMAH